MVTKSGRTFNILQHKLLEKTNTLMYFHSNAHRAGMNEEKVDKTGVYNKYYHKWGKQ